MPKAVASSRAALCQDKMKSAQCVQVHGSTDGPADGPFVPTVTAIATAPDLKWMVLSTDISSVSPCRGAAKQKKAQSGQKKPLVSKTTGRRKGLKEQLSPEEEERRRIRRERNKLAAAKCRNRRRELTDSLQAETDSLEEEKAALQAEISSLMKEKEQLELLLASHKPNCKIPAEMQEKDEVSEEPEKLAVMLQEDPNPTQSLSSTVSLDKMPMSPLGLHQVPTCPQELEPTCPIISGNSDVLLCSSATLEPYIDMKDVPMEELGSKIGEEDDDDDDDMDLLVPDIDLSASLGLTEWETLYMTIGGSLDPLSTPALSPACSTGAVPVFDFPNPNTEASEGKVGVAKAKAGDNSTLLAL